MASAVGARRALRGEFIHLYPDEAARILEERPLDEAVDLLERETPARAATILERMSPDVGAQLIAELSGDTAGLVLAAFDPTRATALLSRLDEDVRERKLALLDLRVARELRELMSYERDSAGALMDPRVTAFLSGTTVEQALARLRALKEKELGAVYVVDADQRLVGTVALGDLAVSAPGDRLDDVARGAPTAVNAFATKEEILEFLSGKRLASLPVVDHAGQLLGVIRARRLMAAAEEEASADLQTMVGVSKDERALSPVLFSVRQRLPWLEINLLTAFLAAAVVGLFEGTIARVTALAVLMPIAAGQSGNTGAQALAVTLRGLSLREIRVRQWPLLFLKELRVGLINGLAVAVTTAAGVFLWSRSPGLALVIGLAMVISMVIASFAGTLVPVVLKAAGQDPAQSSSVVLTTITDVAGFLSFLGLATLLSGLLVGL